MLRTDFLQSQKIIQKKFNIFFDFINMNVWRSIIISADRSFLILLLYYKSGCRSFFDIIKKNIYKLLKIFEKKYLKLFNE